MTAPAALTNHGAWGDLPRDRARRGADRRGRCCSCSSAPYSTSTDRLRRCSTSPGQVAANTAYIPQLQATAPVLGQIVEEAVVQDGYMNALTDGYGGK